jgi:hypothetical protein
VPQVGEAAQGALRLPRAALNFAYERRRHAGFIGRAALLAELDQEPAWDSVHSDTGRATRGLGVVGSAAQGLGALERPIFSPSFPPIASSAAKCSECRLGGTGADREPEPTEVDL